MVFFYRHVFFPRHVIDLFKHWIRQNFTQVKMDPELAQKYEKEMAEAAAMALPDDDEGL